VIFRQIEYSDNNDNNTNNCKTLSLLFGGMLIVLCLLFFSSSTIRLSFSFELANYEEKLHLKVFVSPRTPMYEGHAHSAPDVFDALRTHPSSTVPW